jgi:DNA-binding NtrC family response regulator
MMTSNRTRTADLIRVLNGTEQPVYVLDEDFAVVFLNRACRQWIGESAADAVLGQKCTYRSVADSTEDGLVAALCPPPQVFSGEIIEAAIRLPEKDGVSVSRRVRFLPLGLEKGEIFAVAAILAAEDLPPNVADSASTSTVADEVNPLVLHEQIRRFRMELAGRYGFDRLIGQGPAMTLARRQAELVVTGRANVLLVGPQGSGRRHLAAAIHYAANPPTANAPGLAGELTPLDCSVLGDDLLDAAATALAKGIERSEMAAACTLLFHRIDELPVEMQFRLADFLGRRPLRCRLAATAAASLVDLSRNGKFHADLAALFSTVTIVLPPLAERREDLPVLAQLFVEDWNAAESRQLAGFSPSALERLDAYAWPGNIAELAEIVAAACRRAAGPMIDAGDLPNQLQLAAAAAAHPRRIDEPIVLDEFLAGIERELIERALARAKGNKARAARLLGLTRPRLYRRMVQLGLDPQK